MGKTRKDNPYRHGGESRGKRNGSQKKSTTKHAGKSNDEIDNDEFLRQTAAALFKGLDLDEEKRR